MSLLTIKYLLTNIVYNQHKNTKNSHKVYSTILDTRYFLYQFLLLFVL